MIERARARARNHFNTIEHAMNKRPVSPVFTAALTLILSLFLVACGGDGGGNSGADTAPESPGASGDGASGATGATDTATAGSGAGATADGVREYSFHGTVTKIDAGSRMITIDHEKIGDYMEAMTMPYRVADPAILDQVKVGEETHFTLRVAGDQALITKVEKEHTDGKGH